MCPAFVSGIVIGDAPVSYWPIFSFSQMCQRSGECSLSLKPYALVMRSAEDEPAVMAKHYRHDFFLEFFFYVVVVGRFPSRVRMSCRWRCCQ